MPFYFLFLIVLNAQAVTLSKIMSRPEGTSVQTYEIVKGQGKLFRKTNIYGPKDDLRLGLFTSKTNFKSTEQRINNLSPKEDFKIIEDHRVFLKVNDKFVDPASPLQQKLEQEFASLQQAEWNFLDGIELTADLTEMSEFENGKLKQKKIFPQSYHCAQMNKDQVCKFKDTGILYVP